MSWRPASKSNPKSRSSRSVSCSCRGLVVRAGQERRVRAWPVEHLLDERHEVGAQPFEQRIELGHRHARLVRVEQRVVQVAAVGQRLGLLDLQRQHRLELGLPDGEVFASRASSHAAFDATPAGAARAPGRRAASRYGRGRASRGAPSRAAPRTGRRRRPPASRSRRRRPDRPSARASACERGRVLRACHAPLARAVRLLVPAEEPQRRREILDLPHPCSRTLTQASVAMYPCSASLRGGSVAIVSARGRAALAIRSIPPRVRRAASRRSTRRCAPVRDRPDRPAGAARGHRRRRRCALLRRSGSGSSTRERAPSAPRRC